MGIYDPAYNDGCGGRGTSHEITTFAAGCIGRWWLMRRPKRYAGAKRLLIQADAKESFTTASGNGRSPCRSWVDEFDLVITVTHYPPRSSKRNPIHHRMFSLISGNWAG